MSNQDHPFANKAELDALAYAMFGDTGGRRVGETFVVDHDGETYDVSLTSDAQLTISKTVNPPEHLLYPQTDEAFADLLKSWGYDNAEYFRLFREKVLTGSAFTPYETITDEEIEAMKVAAVCMGRMANYFGRIMEMGPDLDTAAIRESITLSLGGIVMVIQHGRINQAQRRGEMPAVASTVEGASLYKAAMPRLQEIARERQKARMAARFGMN